MRSKSKAWVSSFIRTNCMVKCGKQKFIWYDDLGNRTYMRDHYGKEILYEYNPATNRLEKVIAGTNTTKYSYYNNGLLKSVLYQGGVEEVYTYDGIKNLLTITNEKPDNSVIDKYAYTYDENGNQKSKVENDQSIYYGYDTLNKVQTASTINVPRPSIQDMIVAYTYDSTGNISTEYNREGKEIDAPAGFKSNELNQIIEYTDKNGVASTYTYYPNGLRKTKTTNGVTTTYYYDGNNAIIEAENGNLKYRNIYGMNQIARQDAAGNTYYFLYNGHGDVVKLVDSAGNIKNSYEYDIYGKVKSAIENGIPNPMRYAGQMYESGLYYLRARYYDPRIGRFISEDTNKGKIENPSSLNFYTYCWGNPIALYDPSGNAPAVSMDGENPSFALRTKAIINNFRTAPNRYVAVLQKSTYETSGVYVDGEDLEQGLSLVFLDGAAKIVSKGVKTLTSVKGTSSTGDKLGTSFVKWELL